MLLHLDLLFTHVALHSNNFLLHPAIILIDILHPVSLNSQLFNFLSEFIVLLFEIFSFLH